MPCVDETFDHGYFNRKITSSVMMAIGNGTPMVIHQRLAQIYSLQDGVDCVVYTSEKDSLTNAFQRALEMPPEAYQHLVSNVFQLRSKWLAQLLQSFQEALPKN